jgi:hypothetical protein
MVDKVPPPPAIMVDKVPPLVIMADKGRGLIFRYGLLALIDLHRLALLTKSDNRLPPHTTDVNTVVSFINIDTLLSFIEIEAQINLS